MSIKLKLIILLLFLGLVPTLLLSVVAYVTISRELTSRTRDQLQSVRVTQERRVEGLLQKKREEVIKLANGYELQSSLSAYVTNRNQKALDDINAIIYDKKLENAEIDSINLTNMQGKSIATSSRAATDKSPVNTVDSEREGVIVVLQEDPKDAINKLFITTVITVNQQQTGLLTVIFRIDDIVTTVQDRTGLGTTGETLIAAPDQNKQYVSLFPLRFDTEAALKTQLTSLKLTNTGNAVYADAVDYRSQQVLISSNTVEPTNWIIATKMDAEEAFAPIKKLRNSVVAIVVTSSVAIIIFSLYFTRFLTAPIIALTAKTRSIIQGDFTQRIALKSKDEVGTLAKAFNEMTASLQTSTQKLNEEHARLQSSINSLNIGFLMTAKNGQVVSYNPALLRILGMSAPQGSPLDGPALSLEELQKRVSNFNFVEAVKICLETGQPFTASEVSYGSRFLSVLGAPIRPEKGDVIGAVMVMEDITEAKILARSKEEFFSIASHELRTPLTAIQGNSSMVMNYYPEAVKDPEVKQMIDDIHESSVRLIGIVNDFLDSSSLEQDKMIFKNEPVAIDKIIGSVTKEMEPVIKEKSLSLTINEAELAALPMVWTDTNRTKQVIYNLIGNATKFTKQGGITITASNDKDFVKICVSDTGIGIPLDKQELLFRKFQQAGDSLLTRDTAKGTGLGLYISKMIVEHLGGQMRLEKSEEGKGTTFSVTLPVATPAQQKVAATVSKQD